MHRIALISTLVLFGCDPDVKGSGDSGLTTGSDSGTTIFGTTTGTTTDPEWSATVSGVIYDDAGVPMPDAEVSFCDHNACRYDTTGGDGVYAFAGSWTGWNAFEVVGPSGGGWAIAFLPMALTPYELRDFDLNMVQLEGMTPLGAAAPISVATGLAITVGTGELVPPGAKGLAPEATEVGGAQLDAADFVPTDELPGTAVAQWYLWPFDHHAPNGLTMEIDGGALGLTAPSYHAWVGSYDDRAWLDVGMFEDADLDGIYTSTSTLPLMSTVVLMEE